MGKLDFNKLIGHRIEMDRKIYTIEGRGGIHIGNIKTLKISTPGLTTEDPKNFEYRAEATIVYLLENDKARILPPLEETVKLGSK